MDNRGDFFIWKLWIFIFIIFGIFLVTAQMNSTNYNITLGGVSNGGGNSSSSNYKTDMVGGILSGKTDSTGYTNEFGIFYGSNIGPNTPVVSLNSSDGTNKTLQDLNCITTISDPDTSTLDVSVEWYKNSLLNLSVEYTNQANGSLFVATLESQNTTKGEIWKCGVRFFDGTLYSSWANSSNLTILNTAPTVTLTNPSSGSSTIDRTPTFNWTSSDDDGDSLTYEWNLTDYKFSGSSVCSDSRLEGGISTLYTIPSTDLSCLYDNGYYYLWNVRADDGEINGSWTSDFTINITALVAITLNVDGVNFGSLGILGINDTTDESPPPFIVENNGTVIVNISVNSTALWSSVNGNSTNYQFKADNVSGEEGAFTWITSIINFLNTPINAEVVAIDRLLYTDSKDSAEIDIRVEVPGDEAPGAKSSNIIVKGVLAE